MSGGPPRRWGVAQAIAHGVAPRRVVVPGQRCGGLVKEALTASLAIFAAIRRASSLLSNWPLSAAPARPRNRHTRAAGRCCHGTTKAVPMSSTFQGGCDHNPARRASGWSGQLSGLTYQRQNTKRACCGSLPRRHWRHGLARRPGRAAWRSVAAIREYRSRPARRWNP
jgi:hypothetical protein